MDTGLVGGVTGYKRPSIGSNSVEASKILFVAGMGVCGSTFTMPGISLREAGAWFQ